MQGCSAVSLVPSSKTLDEQQFISSVRLLQRLYFLHPHLHKSVSLCGLGMREDGVTCLCACPKHFLLFSYFLVFYFARWQLRNVFSSTDSSWLSYVSTPLTQITSTVVKFLMFGFFTNSMNERGTHLPGCAEDMNAYVTVNKWVDSLVLWLNTVYFLMPTQQVTRQDS